jgi:2,4-dienoyl-CoA reductase-like NADH-dependent reductase (Old Yellow Enzyme family)
MNWELKFARGGVGGILSSFAAVAVRGRIMPNYAMIDRDAHIPFWRELGRQVHEHDCRFILQLSHSGRQRDIPGIEYEKGLSSTSKPDPLHGFQCDRMSINDIQETVQAFAAGARRAREAGLDGVELHGANGYLITQFLSSAINDRKDKCGGSLANRACFLLEVVAAIRREAGSGLHLQVKISNTIKDSVQVAKWLEEAGVDAIHVSTGSYFPHPKNPAGDFPVDEALKTFPSMISSGSNELKNFLLLRAEPTAKLYQMFWLQGRGDKIEGISLEDSRAIKRAVSIPVICTGGFQTASEIRNAIEERGV